MLAIPGRAIGSFHLKPGQIQVFEDVHAQDHEYRRGLRVTTIPTHPTIWSNTCTIIQVTPSTMIGKLLAAIKENRDRSSWFWALNRHTIKSYSIVVISDPVLIRHGTCCPFISAATTRHWESTELRVLGHFRVVPGGCLSALRTFSIMVCEWHPCLCFGCSSWKDVNNAPTTNTFSVAL